MIFDKKSPVYEIYRNIRSSIAFSKDYENIKAILVTSYQENEGKTTIATNLAVSLGDINKKVLIIDADLRNPGVTKLLNKKNDTGISDIFLNNSEDYSKYTIKHNENIDILPSGDITDIPSEIISSDIIKNIILNAKKEYDYVIVDSHSLSEVSDGAVLSTYCDGSILVGSCGEVEIENAKHAKEMLKSMDSNILGVIINKYE